MAIHANGEPARQLAAAVATGNPIEVAEVASRHIWHLFSQHHRELIAVVVSLPHDVLCQYPALYLIHPSSPVTMSSTRPLSASAFASHPGGQGAGTAICATLQMIASRASGDLITAMTFATFLGDLIRQDRVGDTGSLHSPIWFFHEQIGSTLLCAGSSGPALREFAIARQYGEARGNVDATRTTAGRAAIAHAVRGSVDEAQRQLEIARSLPPLSGAFHDDALRTERTAAALIAVERLDADAEQRIFELDDVDVWHVIWPFVFLARVHHQLATHRPSDALETIHVAESAHHVQPGTLADDVLAATKIEAQLVLGNVETASAIVESCGRPGPFTRLAQVRVALHDSDLAESSVCIGRSAPGRRAPCTLPSSSC